MRTTIRSTHLSVFIIFPNPNPIPYPRPDLGMGAGGHGDDGAARRSEEERRLEREQRADAPRAVGGRGAAGLAQERQGPGREVPPRDHADVYRQAPHLAPAVGGHRRPQQVPLGTAQNTKNDKK
eukprot:3334958-Pyramimonas_sp.AAC.1